jgi:hypothetical protein
VSTHPPYWTFSPPPPSDQLLFISFLDDLYRIAHRDYEPTDDDVVRARLRTMGVQEYRFVFETGNSHFESILYCVC